MEQAEHSRHHARDVPKTLINSDVYPKLYAVTLLGLHVHVNKDLGLGQDFGNPIGSIELSLSLPLFKKRI